MTGLEIKLRLIAEITSIILHLTSVNGHHTRNCDHRKLARVLAPLVVEELVDDYKIALSIISVESSFQVDALSPVGSYGLMQIYPDGVASFLCKKLDYRNSLASHIKCGARIIRYYKKVCGADPDLWLSAYYGIGCRPTKYSKKVLALLK